MPWSMASLPHPDFQLLSAGRSSPGRGFACSTATPPAPPAPGSWRTDGFFAWSWEKRHERKQALKFSELWSDLRDPGFRLARCWPGWPAVSGRRLLPGWAQSMGRRAARHGSMPLVRGSPCRWRRWHWSTLLVLRKPFIHQSALAMPLLGSMASCAVSSSCDTQFSRGRLAGHLGAPLAFVVWGWLALCHHRLVPTVIQALEQVNFSVGKHPDLWDDPARAGHRLPHRGRRPGRGPGRGGRLMACPIGFQPAHRRRPGGEGPAHGLRPARQPDLVGMQT